MALARAATVDDVHLWIHARRLGLTGDGTGAPFALLLDGKVIASSRAFIRQLVLGHNGAGAVTVAGVVVGDVVDSVINMTDLTDVTSSFEGVATVAGQVQQSAATDLSAKKCLFFIRPGS